jgi:hypothetical protein
VTADTWANIVQTAAVVIGAGALVFASRQARLARHGGGGANVLELWTILQSENARASRRALYQAIEHAGPYDAGVGNWTADDVEAVIHVASLLSVTGALAKRDLVPLELVVDEWGRVITRTWAVARPVIEHQRQRRNEPLLFASYEWLVRRVHARM